MRTRSANRRVVSVMNGVPVRADLTIAEPGSPVSRFRRPGPALMNDQTRSFLERPYHARRPDADAVPRSSSGGRRQPLPSRGRRVSPAPALGRGQFGEVWQIEAPGGVEVAAK